MVTPNYTTRPDWTQKTSRFDELETTLAQLNDQPLLTRLAAYRRTGRPGYPLRALWRASVCSYLLDHKYTNVLVRELEDDSDFRKFCGFTGRPPHRTTVLRFFHRLAHHPELVEAAFVNLTEQIKALLPDLGRVVAIDSTVVRSHSNPNRTHISDPEASWTAKTSARAKKARREWYWGYKLHMVADANYGLPLAHLTTTAKRNDSPLLPKVYAHAEELYKWLRPDAAIADRGYDALSNHEYLDQKGIVPIIKIKKPAHVKLREGIYTNDGVPTCIGQVPMRYVRSDPQKGHLYRCVGCPLAKSVKGGIRHCDTEVWEDPTQNIRMFGAIRREGPEWKALYDKRQAIERVFKSMKQSRRLEKHGFRGLRKITLHALMSVLAYQSTALVKLQAGRQDEMRWMVRRVA